MPITRLFLFLSYFRVHTDVTQNKENYARDKCHKSNG